MAKFHGKIGFVQTVGTAPGVHTEVTTEYEYTGDVLRDVRRLENGNQINDNLNISNRFSIIANEYAFLNFQYMRYIKWVGVSWKINEVEIQRPRLILSVGGVYNG